MIMFPSNMPTFGPDRPKPFPAMALKSRDAPGRMPGCPPGAGRPWQKEAQMALEICWLDDLAKGQETARKINKPIFLDFFKPQ